MPTTTTTASRSSVPLQPAWRPHRHCALGAWRNLSPRLTATATARRGGAGGGRRDPESTNARAPWVAAFRLASHALQYNVLRQGQTRARAGKDGQSIQQRKAKVFFSLARGACKSFHAALCLRRQSFGHYCTSPCKRYGWSGRPEKERERERESSFYKAMFEKQTGL